MSTRIKQGLLKWAMAIGRRLLRWLAKTAIRKLVAWMRKHVGVFRERRERARTNRRREWLDGRIKRWTLAAAWLEKHSVTLGKCAVGEFDALAKDVKHIPLVADCEKLVAA